jgi:REP-associated tyrosine transposase
MTDKQSLAHTKWECKYHVVWIPKYRKRKLFGEIRKELGPVLRDLARHKECEILEGKLMVDHIHMLIAIPPKYAVSQVIGYLKGKSAIHIARNYGGRRKNFTGEHFWARGYYVSTVGLDEVVIRHYIQQQDEDDRRLDQLRLLE